MPISCPKCSKSFLTDMLLRHHQTQSCRVYSSVDSTGNRARTADEPITLFVSPLMAGTDANDIREAFSLFSNLTAVEQLFSGVDGRPGFAFVILPRKQAHEALCHCEQLGLHIKGWDVEVPRLSGARCD